MDLFGKSPRPIFNASMRAELAKTLGQEIYDWCNGETDLEDCIEDCDYILQHNSNDNGFELAKEFDDKGYSPDLQLVEILDGVDSSIRDLVREAVKQWVIDDNIKPQFEMDTTVMVKYGFKKVEGIITGHYPETAEYKVAIPSEGMSIETTRRAVIKYENAEAVPQTV